MSDRAKQRMPFAQRVGAWMPDVFVVGGLALSGYGFWLVDPALGFIVPGLLLTVIGVMAVAPRNRGGDQA